VAFIAWKILKKEEAHLKVELLACSTSKSKLKKRANKQTNKQTDFSDATISNVLLDLPFIRKQPLE